MTDTVSARAHNPLAFLDAEIEGLRAKGLYRRLRVVQSEQRSRCVIDGREVTSVSFQNLDKGDSWGTDLNGNLRLGPKFNAFAGFNLFKMVTDGGSQSALSSNAVTWSYRVNATSTITPTVTLQTTHKYLSAAPAPAGAPAPATPSKGAMLAPAVSHAPVERMAKR